ncbi:hypothetical protein HD554DRAFT_2082148 [Boletus coccyginus]|nr:hypothetical protein HD554DRAFT_2082148 [Boletus coccyginus]
MLRTSHAITIAIQSGFTHLDGAQSYRNEATRGVGTVASGKLRSELYITTRRGALEAKAAGLTKSIGVLNFTTGHLWDILEVPGATIPDAWRANLVIHEKYRIVTSSYGGLSPVVWEGWPT